MKKDRMKIILMNVIDTTFENNDPGEAVLKLFDLGFILLELSDDFNIPDEILDKGLELYDKNFFRK